MTSDVQSADPYDAVLADLRAKRDQIDKAIALLSSLRISGGAGSATLNVPATSENGIIETAGMYLGMSIVDASKKLLTLRKQTMGNVEIAREIQKGGLVLTGKDPVNVVGSVLTRRFNEVGDVVKVGRGIWGLKEWYPGRSFKPSGKVGAATSIETVSMETPVVEASVETISTANRFKNPFADLDL